MITVLKFYAPWCGPCRTLSERLEGVTGITEVNIENDMELAIKYHVRKIPVVVFLKGNKEVHREVGLFTRFHFDATMQELNDKHGLDEIDVVDPKIVKQDEESNL